MVFFYSHRGGKFWGDALVGCLGFFAGWNCGFGDATHSVLRKTKEKEKYCQAENTHIICNNF